MNPARFCPDRKATDETHYTDKFGGGRLFGYIGGGLISMKFEAGEQMLATVITFLANQAVQNGSTTSSSDGFSPGLFLFLLCLLAICLILVGVGIVLAAAAVAFCAILVGLGVLSFSALAVVACRRWTAGARALVYQVLAIGGAPCGVGLFWASASLFNLHLRHREILVIGLSAGVIAGLLLAYALDRFVQWVVARVGKSGQLRNA